MVYFADFGGCGIFISKDSELDEYLEKGASIYEQESVTSTERTLLATPERGWIVDRPQIQSAIKPSEEDNA